MAAFGKLNGEFADRDAQAAQGLGEHRGHRDLDRPLAGGAGAGADTAVDSAAALVAGAAVAASALVVAVISAAAAPPAVGDRVGTMNKLLRVIKHRWFDASDARRVVPDDMAERLTQRVTASEQRHTGEIRLCVEAALPTADLWRISPDTPLPQVVRERALEWFGRLGIWDTEDNCGVLVYVNLADHKVEIVADRGISRHVEPEQWRQIVQRMGSAFRAGHHEQGLTEAVDAVTELLVRHFPAPAGSSNPNELPDEPVLG